MFAAVISVSTHTLGATGLDQLTNRCVKLRRQVLLTSLQSRGENRLWLRFRKYTTFSHFVQRGWVKHTQVCNFCISEEFNEIKSKHFSNA